MRWGFTNTSNVHLHNLRNSETNCYAPRPRTEMRKGTCTTEDLFCGTNFPRKSDTCLLEAVKTSLKGKNYF